MTAPHRSLCLIHANCQGDPLAVLLAASPQFAERYEIRRYTNYLRERIAPAELSGCGLFLYQHLGEKWDDHASDRLLAMVNPAARVLRLPNMLFTGYWPFWTNKSPMDFGDSFLDRLVSMGLSMAEILHVYLHGDIAAKYDLDAMLRHSLAVERDKERGAGDAATPAAIPAVVAPTVDLVEALWKQERLFATINHPNRRLVLHMAEGVLAALGMDPLPPAVRDGFTDPYPEFELPIHPQVAAHHGLAFGGPDATFNIYGRRMTFEDYARRYADCRLRGIDNFIGYLQLV
ncbi:WcbI family polysaccharide biosynthesis putative acetyltransferase [Nitratidesulfovibrio sp. 1201_IL3209]|uniref:WcbI family polysaccharide biosynthesis putative acetyltransferase n=1 Tax=Nitratidesulfovibrio sp. 1201_IL3209 TaxID=3084053 RepID=UPI002FDB0BF6